MEKCTLNKHWSYYIVNKQSIFYDLTIEFFKRYGQAFADIKSKIIFYNEINCKDWTTKNYLAVEAHEISHCILGRLKDSIEEEILADLLGIKLLHHYGLFDSAELLIDRLINEDIQYDTYKINLKHLDKYNKYITQHNKLI